MIAAAPKAFGKGPASSDDRDFSMALSLSTSGSAPVPERWMLGGNVWLTSVTQIENQRKANN
jgi:hypothetical protein